MLPILRIVPVGGVLLAILILLLALTPPGGAHPPLSPTVIAARGPLLDRDEHPEWRQLLIRAALRRADELTRLRELPDTPVRIAPVEPETETRTEPVTPAPSEPVSTDGAKLENPQAANAEPEIPQPESAQPAAAPPDATEDAPKLFAGLPADRGSADPAPDDVTGSIDESPGATIPIDIGETSSTELPVVLPEEKPPVIRTPERAKPAHESRRKRARRVHHVKVQPQPPAPLNFFEILFGIAKTQQPQAPATPPKTAQKTMAPDTMVIRQFRADAN